MSWRPTGESRLPRMAGASRWHSWTENGGQTRWEPMAWQVPNYIGAGWQQFCSDSAIEFSRTLTGGLSLLMIFAGFWGLRRQPRTQLGCFCFSQLLVAPLAGTKQFFWCQHMAWVSGQPMWPNCRFPLEKKTVLGALLQRIIDGQSFTSKDIEKAMGRLNWAASARPLRRPFLQPFWWKAATIYYLRETQQAHPLLCAATIYSICSTILRPNLAHMILHRTWPSDKENLSKEDAWWFHYQVPLEDHLYTERGGPHLSNSALETFGILILIHFLLIMGGKTLLEPHLWQPRQHFCALEPKDRLPDAAHRDAPQGRGTTGSFTHEEGLQPVGWWTYPS